MADKKDLYKFTIQFSPGDPSHQQTADILNQQGRRKAQFVVNAVMHYLHCSETPDIPQPIPVDTAMIENIVRRILEKQNLIQEANPSVPDTQRVEHISKGSQNLPLDEAENLLGEDGIAAIAHSIAMFRK